MMGLNKITVPIGITSFKYTFMNKIGIIPVGLFASQLIYSAKHKLPLAYTFDCA